ncbi:hypothetical protein [Staphylococcus arlettae]|uniref:hypothetical protein n=1 Tax=Staphylococcus arlettae TaxID=29378 RepID=UPI001CA771B0|nr:hypothetical protein [Staphylococcus arlettae]QZZ04791.1 hypothetical protein K7H07_10715 [Staphylococcus arlettae]
MMFTKMSVIAYAPPLYVKLTPEIGDSTIIPSVNLQAYALPISCVMYTATNMYNKINMLILIALAVILGVAIHYISESIFNQIEKYQNK